MRRRSYSLLGSIIPMRTTKALLGLVLIAICVRGADAAPRGATCFGKPATIVRGNGDDTITGTGGVRRDRCRRR
jgi:hypothetical protein